MAKEVWTFAEQHEGRVESVAFSSDGWKIVSGSTDGTIKVWGTADLKKLQPKLTEEKGAY